MVKVKTFAHIYSCNRVHHQRLDTQINNFISENGIEEIIDIKYSTSMSGDANHFCLLSAMLIYKDDNIEQRTDANDEMHPTYAEQCRESMRRILELPNNIDKISEEISRKLQETEQKTNSK